MTQEIGNIIPTHIQYTFNAVKQNNKFLAQLTDCYTHVLSSVCTQESHGT